MEVYILKEIYEGFKSSLIGELQAVFKDNLVCLTLFESNYYPVLVGKVTLHTPHPNESTLNSQMFVLRRSSTEGEQ